MVRVISQRLLQMFYSLVGSATVRAQMSVVTSNRACVWKWDYVYDHVHQQRRALPRRNVYTNIRIYIYNKNILIYIYIYIYIYV